MNIARRFLKFLEPHVLKAEIAGSLRRRNKEVGDIEVVCVERGDMPLQNVFTNDFPGIVVNGPRLKRFKYKNPEVQLELYITNPTDFGRILAIRTGSSAYSHFLAVVWNRRGWAGTKEGLRRKKECEKKGSVWRIKKEFALKPTMPPPFYTEADFFQFLGIDWIPPEERNWKSTEARYNWDV